jgi:AcrR family transcriptional regulator
VSERTKTEPRRRRRVRAGAQLGEDTARAMILEAGARVFATHGVRAASVGLILAEAGVARRTFYRLYRSKEDVMSALYRTGTDALVAACRAAFEEERDPLRRVERCVDAHLGHARALGRLMWVLGSEAQHHESPLYRHRMDAHATIAALLAAGDRRVDPLLHRALLLAIEGATRIMLEECDEGRKVTAAKVARTRRVILRIATAAIAGAGTGVTPFPTLHVDRTGRRAALIAH